MLEINKIYCGDCKEVMATFPDNCIDLTVTSPPYDNLREYNGYTFDFEGIAQQLYRITKDGGVVVWVVSDATVNGSETGTSFKQALGFLSTGFFLHDTMIYDRHGVTFPDTNRYYQSFEYMFVFSKGKPGTVNLLSDRKNNWGGCKTRGDKTERQPDNSLKNKGVMTVKQFGIRFNVWRYQSGFGNSTREKNAFKHPAIFPEKLAEDHILSWSNKNDLVLDPFCGSGTTCKMAKENHRKYIGIEISEEYLPIIENRILNAEPQLF